MLQNKLQQIPLYPLLFDVHYQSVLWGGNGFETYLNRKIPADQAPAGEAWEICDRPEISSHVENGALKGISLHDLLLFCRERLLGKRYKGNYRKFPVMIKWIDATRDNSLQVHPDEQACRKIGQNAEPKSELWYVYQCVPSSKIIASWQQECTKSLFFANLKHPENVLKYLKTHDSKPGDIFQIYPGCVHSIGAGNLIFEIQENSVTTFRITDWNRLDEQGNKRKLHVEESMQSIDFDFTKKAYRSLMAERHLPNKPYLLTAANSVFCVEEVLATTDFEADTTTLESFQLITTLDASMTVQCENREEVYVPQGRTVLLAAEQGKFRLHFDTHLIPGCRFLRTFLPENS